VSRGRSERWSVALVRGSSVLACALLLATEPASAAGNDAQAAPKSSKPARHAKAATVPPAQLVLEPRAIDILKAASARLAAAKSMAFTAVVSYESPSLLGPPLVYSTKSQVTMVRPDKLKVITSGDGPPSEFYYDGKTMMAFAPTENLVAVADAPPTIDEALQAAYDSAAIYFPFDDVIVADPYKDIAEGLKTAFYVGQSGIVGDTTTDIVAYVTGQVFVQAWIGTEDKLPRRLYAVYLNDPLRLRHVLALSNWELDTPASADAFTSAKAAAATHMKFARPDATDAPGMQPPPRVKRSQAKPAQSQ